MLPRRKFTPSSQGKVRNDIGFLGQPPATREPQGKVGGVRPSRPQTCPSTRRAWAGFSVFRNALAPWDSWVGGEACFMQTVGFSGPAASLALQPKGVSQLVLFPSVNVGDIQRLPFA